MSWIRRYIHVYVHTLYLYNATETFFLCTTEWKKKSLKFFRVHHLFSQNFPVIWGFTVNQLTARTDMYPDYTCFYARSVYRIFLLLGELFSIMRTSFLSRGSENRCMREWSAPWIVKAGNWAPLETTVPFHTDVTSVRTSRILTGTLYSIHVDFMVYLYSVVWHVRKLKLHDV
jgi:hypothetical protein